MNSSMQNRTASGPPFNGKGEPEKALVKSAAPTVDEVLSLFKQAQAGDQAVVPRLKELLKDPSLVQLTISLMGGDLAWQVRNEAIKSLSGKDLLVKESLERQVELMMAEFAGPNPTPLDKLLADRIGTCWLHLHRLEWIHAKEDMSLEKSAYYQRCIDRAQKRYLGAIKALAVVRKLGVPSVQVNIAKKQVNVAGGTFVENGKLLPT